MLSIFVCMNSRVNLYNALTWLVKSRLLFTVNDMHARLVIGV